MAPPVLYSTELSSPCRAVLLAAAAAGITLDVRETDLRAGEQRKEEFVKMNPQHTVPTLNDNGFILWDSHAIVTYLIDKYAKDDSLYPKDLEKRAVVDQRLHFDTGILCYRKRETTLRIGNRYRVIYKGATEELQEQYERLKESYELLEKFLGDNDWLAGNTFTLADTTIIASVTSTTAFVPLDKYPKLAAWARRCEEKIPGYATANAPGAAGFHEIYGKFRSNV